MIILFGNIATSIILAEEVKDREANFEKESKDVKENEIIAYAEKFTQDERKGITILEKNVRIFRQEGYMFADQVTIYRDVETDEVIKTVAEGNVHMKDNEILADCDHAIFNELDDTIELTGSVVVTQNEDRIEAEYIKYNRTTGERIGKGSSEKPIKFRVKIKTKETESNESESEQKK